MILLPLHHPVRVAEDVITLDLVSKGRVILGVGIGYQPADFRAFSVPMDDRAGRFEESIEILRRCWAGEPFSFHGKHHTLEDVQVLPRPYQKSAARRSWIGASIDAAARRAGRIADGFVGTPSTGMANATHLAQVYQEAAREARRPAEVVQMRDAWVARSRADADAVYGPHVMTAYRYYWDNRLAEFRNLSAARSSPWTTSRPTALILGDPETCVREFQRWQKATGREHVPAPPAARALGRAAAREDHGGDPALRRAGAAARLSAGSARRPRDLTGVRARPYHDRTCPIPLRRCLP